MASVWHKYTTIKLLTSEYDLHAFKKEAFSETMFNDNPHSPFEHLGTKRVIE